MSDKPSAAWYLAPIFLGVIGSAIMWFVLKDEDHPDAPKMVKKGWIIGIALTLISFAWIPFMLIPLMVMDTSQLPMQDHMQIVPEPEIRMVPETTQQQTPQPTERMIQEPKVAPVPAPQPQTQSENSCDPSYPDVCIPTYPPDLDCGEIGYSNFRVTGSDPHGFDRDNDGIGCES